MDTNNQRHDVPREGLRLERVKTHHSFTDWDFDPLGAWHADGAEWHSVPTSLSCYSSDVGGYRFVSLKPALGLCIPDGSIDTWLYGRDWGVGNVDFIFRTQALPASGYPANTYLVRIMTNHIWYYTIVDGVWLSFYDHVPPNPPVTGEWEYWRVTWWQYLNESMQNVIRILTDREISGHWYTQGVADDVNNRWKDSATNRLGFVMQRVSLATRTNIDDTGIWRRSG